MSFDITSKGQVFTPHSVVEKMLKLCRNKGRVLEPSAGKGAFLCKLGEKAVAIEIDDNLIDDKRVIFSDFFDYPVSENKFDTIIGNPPYVRYQDIPITTKELLPTGFDKRTNLYLFFIDKCIDHLKHKGELILITPRDFIKATSAKRLNTRLYDEGSITHFYDMGDSVIFRGYSPNCAIWRWQKGRKDRRAKPRGHFRCRNGQIWFGKSAASTLGDFFSVRVGAVSGADHIFTHKKGETSFVCSTTATDGKLRKMIYNKKDRRLFKHKQELLNRKIRKFNDNNWWEWGRSYYEEKEMRIYVNCKTRNKKPFFASKTKAYDGSVLALFPKHKTDLYKVVEKLNKIDWERLGFVCGGRLLFTQRSLENTPLEIAL